MSKLKAFAAVLKFINGSNNSKEYLQGLCEYITDPAKTDNGKLVATQGCSKNHPLEDMLRNKLLHNKTQGKQGEHLVIAIAPSGENKSPLEVLNVVKGIVATVFPENMAIIAGHTDSKYLHFHVALDAVNAVTGRKFSQSPADLNRVKQKANNILKKHGFELITASANEFVDHTDYSNEEGFDFLELDESEIITERQMDEISTFTESIHIEDLSETTCDIYDDDCYPAIIIGGFYSMNNNHRYTPSVSEKTTSTTATPTVEAVSSTTPTVLSNQRVSVPTAAVETVPVTCGTTNNYPNTNVITGPIFRIKGTPGSNISGINELVQQTTAYAQKHQRESSNLALAMQEHSQREGYPTNVTLVSGPLFDIETTGLIDDKPQIYDIYEDDYNYDDDYDDD